MPHCAEPYTSSGSLGLGWLLPVVGLVSAAIAAFLYAYVNVYSPIAGYISILFVAGLAVGAALPLAYAARLLKCRNMMLLQTNGVCTGVLAIYLAWAFFVHVLYARGGAQELPSMWEIAMNPDSVWERAEAISEEGWYTIGSLTPSGIVLWGFWLVEAVIVVGASTRFSTHFVDGLAFCEDCETWCEAQDEIMIPMLDDSLKTAAEEQGLTGLQKLPPPDTETTRWLRISSQACPQCQGSAVYAVNQIPAQASEDGEVETAAEEIIPMSIMTLEDRGHIERIRSQQAKASGAEEEAESA